MGLYIIFINGNSKYQIPFLQLSKIVIRCHYMGSTGHIRYKKTALSSGAAFLNGGLVV